MSSVFSFSLSQEAKEEYEDSYLWYEEQLEGLGSRFANSVRKKLEVIVSNPDVYSKKKGRFHEASLDKPFPFVIVYIVNKKQKQIVVTSIFHTSRNPKLKYKRRK